MRNRSVLGAAVLDAVVVHACGSRTAARRSHISHFAKERYRRYMNCSLPSTNQIEM